MRLYAETKKQAGQERQRDSASAAREINQTCSPSLEKFAERMDGDTMISSLENLSTREDAVMRGTTALANEEDAMTVP